MARPYEVIESKREKHGRFELRQDKILKDGQWYPYSYIIIGEGVCVLPVYKGDVVVIQQYRHTIDSWEWEFPAGIIDAGEEPVNAAVRELKEETGFETQNIISLGSFYPSFGSTTELIHLFCIECALKGDSNLDQTELIKVETRSMDEIEQMINKGLFRMGAGLMAWYRYCNKKNNHAKV